MNFRQTISVLFTVFLLGSIHDKVTACSMYKVTAQGKTMVGCNEDNWRTTSKIWFVNARNQYEYGLAFTGSRMVKENQFAPQSGMNEAGLAYSRLASYFPRQNSSIGGKLQITDEVTFLTDILLKCANIEDVRKYIEKYDHSIFIDDVFIYIDNTGKYLVVEPYNLIEGNDSNYVLSNFCPSITDRESARKLERYKNGEDFLKTHDPEATLAFCTAVSDTMHVCRNRNGDGTLLTSIWDTKNGTVNLFFYHSYDSTVQFSIKDELAKGDHIFDVANLFPINPEFERLSNYVTPFNTPSLRVLLVILGGFLTVLSLIFGIVFIRKRKTGNSSGIMPTLFTLNVLLTTYFFVLATNIGIYYFDAPFTHFRSQLISASSYTPFLLALSFIPVLIYSFHYIQNNKRKPWLSVLVVGNLMIYGLSISGFGYWGLFDIFS
jgi:hypothetical protein